MDSHVYRKAAWRLPYLANIAVLRFNTRGTHSPRGTSEGEFGGGGPEGADVRAAVDFAVARGLPNRWLARLELWHRAGARCTARASTSRAPCCSPRRLHRAGDGELEAWAASGKPVTILVPEFDDYLRPDAAREAFAPLTQANIVAVDGAKHLWVGEPYVRRVLDEIVGVVAPQHAPLPTHVPARVAQ